MVAGDYPGDGNRHPHLPRMPWKEKPQGLLLPNRKGRPWKRAHVVKFGLWPCWKSSACQLTTLASMLSAMESAQGSLAPEPRQLSFSGRYGTPTSKPHCASTESELLVNRSTIRVRPSPCPHRQWGIIVQAR